MPPALQAKFAGLPRWAWLAILAGGLTIGLILRSRQSADEEAVTEEVVDEGEVIADSEYVEDAGYLGDPGYDFEDTEEGGAFFYQGPPLPTAVAPNITVNVSGGGKRPSGKPGGTKKPAKKKCGPKPKRKLPKGKEWKCRGNGKWVAVAKAKKEGTGDGPGTVDEHELMLREPEKLTRILTGGGPPSRRHPHTPPRRTQHRRAHRIVSVQGSSPGRVPVGYGTKVATTHVLRGSGATGRRQVRGNAGSGLPR